MTNYDDVIVLSNPKFGLSHEVLAAMNARRDAHVAYLRERAAKMAGLRPTNEEREIRQKVRSSVMSLAGVREQDAERISQARRCVLEDLTHVTEPLHRTARLAPLDPAPIAGEGELWWVQTYVTMSGLRGVIAFFQEDGLHLVGKLETYSGDLQKGNVTVVAQFGLGTDRMPAGQAFQFVSNPVAVINGWVSGFTFGGPLDFGDHWAKCWLNTSQYVYGGLLPLHVPLFSGHETRTMVFLESDFDHDVNPFPGYFSMPLVEFVLADRTNPIQIDLEFSFDFQLESDATVQVGFPAHNESVVLQTRQWKIEPV